jgi:putative transposase
VAKWAAFFQVSRSGYYAFIARRDRCNEHEKRLKASIKLIFDESDGTYGADRICGVMRKSGRKASYRKVSGYMAELGLKSVHNRHKMRSLTDSRKSRGEVYPDLVRGQCFVQPCKAVCSDITYLKSGEGWLYLCAVKDIVTGEILGEATNERMKKELVISAFLNAQARHGLEAGTIFHSDRGSQYTSTEFTKILKLYGLKQSFSRVGMPGDNAWAESFFCDIEKGVYSLQTFSYT